jgi:hypothetical protein
MEWFLLVAVDLAAVLPLVVAVLFQAALAEVRGPQTLVAMVR